MAIRRRRNNKRKVPTPQVGERANGYSYDAVKIFMPAGAKEPVIVHYTEHCPPDVGAAFIWLKNRDPERWRDVQNVEHVMGKYLISDKSSFNGGRGYHHSGGGILCDPGASCRIIGEQFSQYCNHRARQRHQAVLPLAS